MYGSKVPYDHLFALFRAERGKAQTKEEEVPLCRRLPSL